jgi:hypothetical protein
MPRAGARRLPVVVAAIVVAAATACSSTETAGDGSPPISLTGSTPSDATPAGGTSAGTASLTGPPSTVPAAAPPTGAGVAAPCRASGLGVELAAESVAPGYRRWRLVLSAEGPEPCTITGYPGVSYLDAGGAPVGAPATREPAPVETVTLAPGATASALIDDRPSAAVAPGACGTPVAVTALRVYVPDDTEPVPVPVPLSGDACPADVGQLSVRPVQAGRDSQP